MADQEFSKKTTIPPLALPKMEEKVQVMPAFIGPYKIETLLEKGGMSLLYLGTHPDIPVPITIKVLSPKFLSHPEMTSRFLKEAEIIALADHPNIVKLYGQGQWEEGLYIAMEFVQGKSLRQYLTQHPLSLKTALEIVLEIAYALCHLHTHGVIHRDLKPENILINQKGHVKVIDFGIAQLINPLALDKDNEDLDKKILIGTPIYMSPEQLENPASTSYPSDIFSLGIIAYELILGKLQGGQVHLSLVPRGLEKILAKSLQPKVSERYLDIVDFISDLTSYLHSPQFEKEKKASDQAGELFEKLQIIQNQLIPEEILSSSNIRVGFCIHRPLGYSGLLIEASQEGRQFILGESANLQMDNMLHMLYIKGLVDGLLSSESEMGNLASKLNEQLMKTPNPFPCSFAFLKLLAEKIQYLSCGYSSLWKISQKTASSIAPANQALGHTTDAAYSPQEFPFQPKDKFVIFPLAEKNRLFPPSQFRQLLESEQHLSPQMLAESLYRKAQFQHPRYFDDHPFLILVLEC